MANEEGRRLSSILARVCDHFAAIAHTKISVAIGCTCDDYVRKGHQYIHLHNFPIWPKRYDLK